MNFLSYLLCYGSSSTATTSEETSSGSSWWIIIVYIVIFGLFIYFVMIRPSKKQKKQQEATMNALEPGDSVLTTSGFYGTVVAVTGDTVIVEFGNNKNCRIPMAKTAIAQVEKANAPATPAEPPKEKKFFGRKKDAQIEESSAEPGVSEPSAPESEVSVSDSSETASSQSDSSCQDDEKLE